MEVIGQEIVVPFEAVDADWSTIGKTLGPRPLDCLPCIGRKLEQAAQALPQRQKIDTSVSVAYSDIETLLKTTLPRQGACYCVFRPKLDTDSGPNSTAIPEETGQGFQRKLDTDSGVKLDSFLGGPEFFRNEA